MTVDPFVGGPILPTPYGYQKAEQIGCAAPLEDRMKDALHHQLWIDHRDRFSEGARSLVRRPAEEDAALRIDPLPLVAGAAAASVALGLTGLTLAVAIG